MDERVAKILRRKLVELEIPFLEKKRETATAEMAELQRQLSEAYATRDAINDALLGNVLEAVA